MNKKEEFLKILKEINLCNKDLSNYSFAEISDYYEEEACDIDFKNKDKDLLLKLVTLGADPFYSTFSIKFFRRSFSPNEENNRKNFENFLLLVATGVEFGISNYLPDFDDSVYYEDAHYLHQNEDNEDEDLDEDEDKDLDQEVKLNIKQYLLQACEHFNTELVMYIITNFKSLNLDEFSSLMYKSLDLDHSVKKLDDYISLNLIKILEILINNTTDSSLKTKCKNYIEYINKSN